MVDREEQQVRMDFGAQVELLMKLSKNFPELTIWISLLDGNVTVGIPKGERGDLFAAAWGNQDGTYQIPSEIAERN